MIEIHSRTVILHRYRQLQLLSVIVEDGDEVHSEVRSTVVLALVDLDLFVYGISRSNLIPFLPSGLKPFSGPQSYCLNNPSGLGTPC